MSILGQNLWIPFCKFRTANHKFPVEVYSWTTLHLDRENRKCCICNRNDIGDEYHYLMLCPVFSELRNLYLPSYYKNRPSVYKFTELMQSTNTKTLTNVAKFIRDILEVFQ